MSCAHIEAPAPIAAQIAALTRRIEQFMHALPDGLLMKSFPRAGQVCAAQVPAELGGDVRERFPQRRTARRRGGYRARDVPIRQDAQRRLSLGVPSPPAPSHHVPGRQLAPRQRLGQECVPSRQSARLRPHPRYPNPGQSRAARDLAGLDRPQTLQRITTVRLKVQQHQLVGVVGQRALGVIGLQGT